MPSASGQSPLETLLRSVERPAAVFAELMGVSWLAGDAAVAAAMRSLAAIAPLDATLPKAEWPHRFWHLLLEAPALRRAVVRAPLDPALMPILQQPRGQRSAVLLALLAGLPDADAAAALGVATATFQRALRLGLPRRQGAVDVAQWTGWQEAARERVAALPPQRLAQLARSRAAALASAGLVAPAPVSVPTARHARSPLAVALATGLALAATFLHRAPPRFLDDPDIRQVALPRAAAPATRFDALTALLTHPDFERATDPQALQSVDLELHAWYASRIAASDAPPLPVHDPVAMPGPAHDVDAL